jgi:pimeloyl-ACP methyl ester carboxylesterase
MNALTPSVLRAFLRNLLRPGFWKRPQRLNFAEATYACLNLLPPDRRQAEHAQFRFEAGRAAFEIGFWYLDPRHAAQVDAAKIDCPILVIAGGKDRLTPVSVVRKIARRYARTMTYKEFPNHSHWIIRELGWEEAARFTADWLDAELARKPAEA